LISISKNHIQCVCHKIALILNAGLAALQIPTDGLTYSKEKPLGFVPGLALIAKESEIKKADFFVEEDVSDNNDENESNDIEGKDKEEYVEGDAKKTSFIHSMLKKLTLLLISYV
jgi:hypothetical protein